jgi:hypothetical protein
MLVSLLLLSVFDAFVTGADRDDLAAGDDRIGVQLFVQLADQAAGIGLQPLAGLVVEEEDLQPLRGVFAGTELQQQIDDKRRNAALLGALAAM